MRGLRSLVLAFVLAFAWPRDAEAADLTEAQVVALVQQVKDASDALDAAQAATSSRTRAARASEVKSDLQGVRAKLEGIDDRGAAEVSAAIQSQLNAWDRIDINSYELDWLARELQGWGRVSTGTWGRIGSTTWTRITGTGWGRI